MVGEDAGDRLTDLREPDRVSIEDVLDGEAETTVSREQRPDAQAAPARRGVIGNGGSGRSVTPDPSFSRSPPPG